MYELSWPETPNQCILGYLEDRCPPQPYIKTESRKFVQEGKQPQKYPKPPWFNTPANPHTPTHIPSQYASIPNMQICRMLFATMHMCMYVLARPETPNQCILGYPEDGEVPTKHLGGT